MKVERTPANLTEKCKISQVNRLTKVEGHSKQNRWREAGTPFSTPSQPWRLYHSGRTRIERRHNSGAVSVKVEVAVLGSPSLMVLMASVDINQQWTWTTDVWLLTADQRRMQQDSSFSVIALFLWGTMSTSVQVPSLRPRNFRRFFHIKSLCRRLFKFFFRMPNMPAASQELDRLEEFVANKS